MLFLVCKHSDRQKYQLPTFAVSLFPLSLSSLPVLVLPSGFPLASLAVSRRKNERVLCRAMKYPIVRSLSFSSVSGESPLFVLRLLAASRYLVRGLPTGQLEQEQLLQLHDPEVEHPQSPMLTLVAAWGICAESRKLCGLRSVWR